MSHIGKDFMKQGCLGDGVDEPVTAARVIPARLEQTMRVCLRHHHRCSCRRHQNIFWPVPFWPAQVSKGRVSIRSAANSMPVRQDRTCQRRLQENNSPVQPLLISAENRPGKSAEIDPPFGYVSGFTMGSRREFFPFVLGFLDGTVFEAEAVIAGLQDVAMTAGPVSS